MEIERPLFDDRKKWGMSFLNLHIHIPQREIRRKILSYLAKLDREHNSARMLRRDFCDLCAASGYTSVLLWAYKARGCTWSEWAYRIAACHGHLETLQAMIDLRSPLDKQATVVAACRGGQLDVLRWLVDNAGYPLDNSLKISTQVARKFGDDGVERKRGCTSLDATACTAASRQQLSLPARNVSMGFLKGTQSRGNTKICLFINCGW